MINIFNKIIINKLDYFKYKFIIKFRLNKICEFDRNELDDIK